MDAAVVVGESDRLGDFPNQVHARLERERCLAGSNVVVQPDCAGVVLEQQRRPEVAVLELQGLEQAGVRQVFQRAEFPFCGATDRLAQLRATRRAGRDRPAPGA